jgi:hypothetical protein
MTAADGGDLPGLWYRIDTILNRYYNASIQNTESNLRVHRHEHPITYIRMLLIIFAFSGVQGAKPPGR